MSFNSYQAIQYLKFLRESNKKLDSQNPFFEDLTNEVFNDGKFYYDFEPLEKKRKALLSDTTEIYVTDLGAGSKKLKQNKRLISDIAKYSLTKRKFSQVLFRLANKYQPKIIFELGTSLGLQTAYFAKACPKSSIWTFEGCGNIMNEARSLSEEFEVKNVNFVEGNMDDTLESKLSSFEKVDMAFIDGNHSYEATTNYGRLLLEKSHSDSIMIFDDIYWSEGMTKAWNEIKKDSRVKLSIDLFYMGIVFFDSNLKEGSVKLWY